MMMLLGVMAGGGLGACARFALDSLIAARLGQRSPVPLGTTIINVLGSFGLGILVAVAGLDAQILTIVGAGVLGGFTTFSTAMVEAARLCIAGQPRRGLGLLLGCWLLSLVAAGLGLLVGSAA